MSILKTNNAIGAYKSAAEWVKNHFNVGVDLEKLEKSIELKGETYDINKSAAEGWDFKWGLRKLIFEDNQSIQIPTCFSQSFLDRIEVIELENHSKFDPDQIKDFPILRNLKQIHCIVSNKDDIYSFLDKICHLAKRIAPEGNNIVSVTIYSDRMMRLPGGSEFPGFYFDGKFYGVHCDGKNIEIEPQSDVKASIVQCNNTIIKYLCNINIESLSELEVCADYFVSGEIYPQIESNSLKKLVIKPLCTKNLKRKYLKENCLISIRNCHLDLLDIPDDFPIEIINSNISGLKGLLDNCSRIRADNRSIIKSGLGVAPISSPAIDMFGNFIHPNDIVAVPEGNEIMWCKVIDARCEKVSVIVALLPEDQKTDDTLSYEEYYYMNKRYLLTRIEKIEIDGKIRKAYVTNISDKICWKIDASFLEKSDANKFYEETIQLLKSNVSFVPGDPFEVNNILYQRLSES